MPEVAVQWKGELRLAFVDDDRVTFYLHPDDPPMDLTPGGRYAVVMVKIADDERPAPPEPDRQAVTKPKRAPSNVAAILCKDPQFQGWASNELYGMGRGRFLAAEETARELIRFVCRVETRADLDINEAALRDFQEKIEIPFYRWRDRNKG